MKRKSNITVWQLRLFEGFDKDVIVMQRDEEEVFDQALHVFFDKEYYDTYVNKAKKYSEHRYAYHEDKLGEVIYQLFDEQIEGLVLHITPIDQGVQNHTLCEEKYLALADLVIYQDIVESYHYLYTAAIDRMPKEEAVAKLWNKNVYIIGQMPDFTKPAGEKQTVELMTLRRKKDGTTATADDFDYESLKVFLTPESAMRFNPDKKPVNRYKLSMLAHFVKDKLQVVVEPHRNYWVEFDPKTIDVSKYINKPVWNEEKVRERIQAFSKLEEAFLLLASNHSDYRTGLATPLLVKMQEMNVAMFLFETYDDAVKYVIQNPAMTPIFDGIYPIGRLQSTDKVRNVHTMLAIANAMGVSNVNLDMETEHSIGCKVSDFLAAAGLETDLEKILSAADYKELIAEKDGKPVYRLPVVPFVQQDNPYMLTAERKEALTQILDQSVEKIVDQATMCTLPEMMFILNQAGIRFDGARKEENEAEQKKFNKLMNVMTIPIADALLEKPFIYTLRNEDGSFTLKNELAYLLITNRFENGRGGDGKLTPASIDNENFMEKLEEASKVCILTDGPNCLCLLDIHLLNEVIKQRKKAESLMEEMLIYMTQALQMSYTDALQTYNRLKIDNGIFVEFVACVRNGEFSPMGMISVSGYDAKKLSEEKNLNPVQAYVALLDLKMNPKEEKDVLKKVVTSVNASVEEEAGVHTEGKKSIFGKFFRK